MTKTEVIARLARKLEMYKDSHKRNKDASRRLASRFTCIGAPLNDNRLQFNSEQLKWLQETLNIIEEFETP